MPYILSPKIKALSPGMWSEGPAYEKKVIYSIESGQLPPVNYDEHVIRAHSLTHFETPAHTLKDGKRLDHYFNQPHHFYGKTVVLKLQGNKYSPKGNGIYHWIIEKNEILNRLSVLKLNELPAKVLITSENYPENEQGFHDPNYVLTLSQEAADYLIQSPEFHLYGTSWKSSDYNPGKAERPVHNTLFEKGAILENLSLNHVPEGVYFMTAFPLPLEDASESPVVPALFTKEELLQFF